MWTCDTPSPVDPNQINVQGSREAGKEANMANAHINEQSGDIDQVTERPSRSWTTLELPA